MKPYKLMCSLFGHTADVKSLCLTRDNGGFVSVSRDLSAKMWIQTEQTSNQYVQAQVISTHKKYVNSVTVVYTLKEYPNGLIITGSNDQTIAFHDIEANKVIAQFTAHDGPVCTLNFDNCSQSNLLFSGSFDCTAKVWNLNDLVRNEFKLSPVITIKGHDLTVWDVLSIDQEGVVLTASADKSIKHWTISAENRNAECLLKYIGHGDCVRGLTLNIQNRQEFFSCSNDGNIIQWRLGHPTPIQTIRVTDSFLYSLNCFSQNGCCYVISSSEDRSLRVHSIVKSYNELVQTIVLPCQTLWKAIHLTNDNLAVACSDATIRLFTQHESLMATAQEMQEFETELAKFAIPVKTNEQMSNINLNKLPGVDALMTPGKRDGQNLIVNNQNEAEVYQWDANDSRWIKIGVAVGSSDAGGGQTQKVNYMGNQYDYVFDIELDEGKNLKLAYNLTEDPYHAAQKFIHQHDLNQHFLDQIAQFLIQNTQSQVIGSKSQSSGYYDPFTGGNRYVPSSFDTSSTAASSNNSSDPFTASSAYTTSKVQTPNILHSNEFYPHKSFVLFDQYNLETIFKKIRELYSQNENFVNDLEKMVKNGFSSLIFDQLFEFIDQFSQENLFPFIDLTRIIVLDQEAVNYIVRNEAEDNVTQNFYVQILFKQLTENNAVNSMLVMRVLCNLFKSFNLLETNKKLVSLLLNERNFLFNYILKLSDTNSKTLQTSCATLFLNYTVLNPKLVNLDSRFSASFCTDLIVEQIEFVNNDLLCNRLINWDHEALFRMLVAFGNLLNNPSQDLDKEYLISIAKSLNNAIQLCKSINNQSQNYIPKVSKCSKYLVQLLD